MNTPVGDLNKAAILGAGSWGTALAELLARKGVSVALWARDKKLAEVFSQTRHNPRYLPSLSLSGDVTVTADMGAALSGVEVVVLAVPAQAMRSIVRQAKGFLSKESMLVSLAKGIEIETRMRMSEVLHEELSADETNARPRTNETESPARGASGSPLPGIAERPEQRIAVLSGPNHAEEVSQGIPSATVVSAFRKDVALQLQALFMASHFRVYTNPDIVGVELGGAVKNVIAIAAGISDGLGYGDNTKASLMTRGLAEMTRLGKAMGADPLTFAGLAGAGDLIVTCTSRYSRNRWVGEQIASGKSLDQVLEETSMVAEGVKTVIALCAMARQYKVEMPITHKVNEVLYSGKRPGEAVSELMHRGPADELPWPSEWELPL